MSSYPLLPSDQYLASLLGLSAEEYRFFKTEALRRANIRPGTITAGAETLLTISLIFALISIGLTIAASFFKPKARQQGQINVTDGERADITRNQRFAPRSGFDSVQRPAVLGTTIPIVYANRETYAASSNPPRPAGKYGGIRVNLPLIWSQMMSIGGDQFLRAMFMVGEANTASIESLAIGDNPVGSYDLFNDQLMQECAKLTIYYRSTGGRIQPADYVWGRAPSNDLGNAVRYGAADVYQIISTAQAYRPDFCFSSKPSNSTRFGLSKWIPNGTAYRVNPTVQATGQIERQSRNNGAQVLINWTDDYVALANVWKFKYQWSRRSGVISSTGQYAIGSTFQYALYCTSDISTVLSFDAVNARESDVQAPAGEAKSTDIANTIASMQNSVDESLVVGDTYKFGNLLAVLISRSPEDAIFISDAENVPPGNGQTMIYTFKVTQAGYLEQANDLNPGWSGGLIKPPEWFYTTGGNLEQLTPPTTWKTVSARPQGFRCDIADVTLTRACKVFEVGLRSSVGLKISGFSNLKDSPSYAEANNKIGGRLTGATYNSDQSIAVQAVGSGSLSMSEERYSFFKIYVRAKSTDNFTLIPASFSVRSNTGQAIYNYIRFEMPTTDVWELRFEPISSWEMRNGYVSDPYIVLDPKTNTTQSSYRNVLGGILITWTGTTVSNSLTTFRLNSIEPNESRGLGYSDHEYNVMTDPWGKCAEAFCYEQLQTTVNEGPEHEVVYINAITSNSTTPLYENLSILGLNIKASQQWSQLSQVSVYASKGRTVKRLLQSDSLGASNLFPDILRDLLLSPTFGLGDLITENQIDTASFITAAQWCLDRRYFYDGVLAEKVNLRQWAADVAASMLLELVQRDGRFVLIPSITFPTGVSGGGPVPISALFTVGNIVENTFSMEFMTEEDRQPVRVSVKWREERVRANYSLSGMFPVEREVTVRETSANATDPIESFDLTDYCTNFEHAVDFACYIIRVRRLVTHSIKFSTTPDGIETGLRAGDYIKVALDFTHYDEFANGVILADGTIVSTRPDLLTTGTHSAVYWNGGDNPIVEGTITVNATGLGSPTNIMFIKQNVDSQIRVYKVESITLGENGVIDIEAVHHPVDSSGMSLLGVNWTTYVTDSNWVIDAV